MTQVVLATVLGLLFAVGTFLVLRRDVVRVVWGVTIISQAANVYLVTMGGLSGAAPVLGHGASAEVTDPLVQALVLTAIVIGFGTTAFALALTFRVYQTRGSIDLGEEPDVSGGEGPAAVAADGGEGLDAGRRAGAGGPKDSDEAGESGEGDRTGGSGDDEGGELA
jgi:multicomponent Na+:H+ antiporter subunit C